MEAVEIILNKGVDEAAKEKKFNSSLKKLFVNKIALLKVILLFLLGSTVVTLLISETGIVGGLLFILVVIAIPMVYAIVAYPKLAIITLLVVAYFIMFTLKYVPDVPLGTLIDSLEALLILGFFIQQKKEKNWKVFKGEISVLILIWIFYNFLEAINPWAASTLAWLYTVRSVGVLMLMYFIFLYHIRTVAFIKLILKIWIALSVIAALYGLKQQYIGFSAVEEQFLYSDPAIAELLFIGGEWRKFSIFSDPVSFSYNMVVSTLLCLALMTGPLVTWKKLVLALCSFVFIYSMIFSGTRGAYVLIPAALILFAILKYSKKLMLIMMGLSLFIAFLIMIPTSNYALYRFQSAFIPSDDASFNVRRQNQKRIRPFILDHPIGGGLGATGVWGVRFAPKSYLANFPPDSGLVRVAVEMGWIGLFIFCCLMFTIIKTGINNYYRIKDPELKSYCLAMVLIVFALNVGNYPQEALVQFPTSIYFYVVVALIVVTHRIDKQKQLEDKCHAKT